MHRYVRWSAIGLILAANLVLWIVPSDVVELVARHRHVILGRYSKERAALLILLIPVSGMALFLLFATRETIKRRCFALVALSGTLALMLVPVDCALRAVGEPYPFRYDQGFATRFPDQVIEDTYEDVPPAARSYAGAPKGHEPVAFRFSTDKRGFRNVGSPDSADIVVLGDSFAEGSRCTDDGTWPALLSKSLSRSVYSMGMSGGDGPYYVASLKKHGLALKPKTVICMIYAGNDFKGKARLADPLTEPLPLGKRWDMYIDTSPIKRGFEDAVVGLLGSVGADGPVPGGDCLSWMPLELKGRHYAFVPRRLALLYHDREQFRALPGWKNVTAALTAIADLCKSVEADLNVVYAPSKPQVVFPVVAETLPADRVREYLLLRRKKLPDGGTDMPPGPELVRRLVESADVPDRAMAELCEKLGARYISLVPALRRAAVAGEQVYYTYDQHWAPAGNRVAADAILRALFDR